MDDQQGFVVGVSSGVRPIEAPRDHCFVVDHGELVIDILELSLLMAGFRSAEGE